MGNESMRVSVDQDFARIGEKAYAINKINTVEVRNRRPNGQAGVYVWGLLALICAILGFENLTSSPTGLGYLLVGAFCAFLAYRAWLKSRIVEYQLFLMTSSSESQAITSVDHDLISSLRDQIERAMAGKLSESVR